MTELKNLNVEKKDTTLVITVTRERALNALNKETVAELQHVFDSHHDDDSIAAVVITGAGAKSFVAGADIAEMSDMDEAAGAQLSGDGLGLMMSIQTFPKPVIAAVNGFALGGGCELAMACDIRIASEKARFGQPEVNLGVIPGYGGTQRLSRLVGRGKAMQLVLTGEMIDAAEAHRIGLVDEVFPPEELMDKALEMAKVIATKGPLAVAAAKECINGGLDVDLAAGCNLEKKAFGALFASADQKEGMKAFMEKRKAEFKGK